MKDKIDFVITWVDGNDEEWLKEKQKTLNEPFKDNNNSRYRDWENLQYIFRGIEKYANWFNKIYFITWGHIPKWLNTNNKRLVIVNHKDYIPKEYLPTYSSHVLELNFHRIKGLSEKFVYLNDDTFFVDYLKKEDFFKNNMPVDYAILTAIASGQSDLFPHVLLNNMSLINKNFNIKKCIKKNPSKWFNIKYGAEQIRTLLLLPWGKFTGLKYSHLPSALLKSSLKEIWEKEYETLNNTCMHKVRQYTDVNQYIIKSWQIAKGQFYPMKPKIGKLYNLKDENTEIINEILKKKVKMCCLNDNEELQNFEKVKKEINNLLETILPEKSSFEK